MLFNVVKHHLHVCTEVISLDPDLGNLPLASAGNTGQPYVVYKWFINYPGVKGRVEKGSCDIINQGTFICLQFCFYDRKLAPIAVTAEPRDAWARELRRGSGQNFSAWHQRCRRWPRAGRGTGTAGTMGRWRSGLRLRSAWDCATRARCQHHRQPAAARCCPLAQLSFRSHHHLQTWKRCLTKFGMESTIMRLLLFVESYQQLRYYKQAFKLWDCLQRF